MIRVYNIAIWAFAAALVACTITTIDEEGVDTERTVTGTPSAVVEWMDDILVEQYLYNDEYNSMDIDYDMEYDEYLDYHLLNMTTNVFDRKYNSSTGSYEIYSYIDQYSSSVSMSRSLNSTEDGLGIVNLVVSLYDKSRYCFGVLGVYPDSPAYNVGIRRGDIIISINGGSITSSNYYTYAVGLLYPTVETSYTLGLYGGGSKSVTAAEISPNPVLYSDTFSGDIGYLVYSQFNNNFDNDLLTALAKMSNVKNFILDLRLNGGGYNSSAVKLGSAIRGSVSDEQVFAEYVYNSNLTGKQTQYDYFNSSYAKLNNLTDKKIYCLVSGSTASASELTINALEGIGFEVILIGDTTEGKNVGMFVHSSTIEGYEYSFAPITFASKNAVGFYEYQDGFAPDYDVDEYSGFADFGSSDPLVATALNLIDSSTYPAVSISRSAETLTPIEIIERKYPRGVLRKAE